jgi:hypothetical protein
MKRAISIYLTHIINRHNVISCPLWKLTVWLHCANIDWFCDLHHWCFVEKYLILELDWNFDLNLPYPDNLYTSSGSSSWSHAKIGSDNIFSGLNVNGGEIQSSKNSKYMSKAAMLTIWTLDNRWHSYFILFAYFLIYVSVILINRLPRL